MLGIIAIVNNKGGVGKTTTAQNVGAAIATFTASKKKGLLIDLDPRGSLTKWFGIRLPSNTPTSGSFILGKVTLEQSAITYNQSNIDVLPASRSLLADEKLIEASGSFPFNLKQALAESKKQ